MKKKKEITLKQVLKNNIYACRLLAYVSRSRTVHSVIKAAVYYFDWIFYSAIFMRFVMQAIEQQKSFCEILKFIIIVSLLFLIITLYKLYMCLKELILRSSPMIKLPL